MSNWTIRGGGLKISEQLIKLLINACTFIRGADWSVERVINSFSALLSDVADRLASGYCAYLYLTACVAAKKHIPPLRHELAIPFAHQLDH